MLSSPFYCRPAKACVWARVFFAPAVSSQARVPAMGGRANQVMSDCIICFKSLSPRSVLGSGGGLRRFSSCGLRGRKVRDASRTRLRRLIDIMASDGKSISKVSYPPPPIERRPVLRERLREAVWRVLCVLQRVEHMCALVIESLARVSSKSTTGVHSTPSCNL